MKILYTADNRQDAQLAANAVRGLADDVKVVWAARLPDAGQWVSQNQDLAALVVDADVQGQSCAPLVRHVRSLGLPTQILVVVSDSALVPAAVLGAGADGFVVRNESLFTNLATLIGRAMHRDQTEQRLQAALSARVRLHEAIEKQLQDAASLRQKLDTRLADALTLLQRRDADVETTLGQLRKRESELADAAETRRVLEQRLADVEETLRTQIATHDSLDRELATAREEMARAAATLREVEAHHVSALASAAEAERQAVQRQAALESAISQEITGRHAVERELEAVQQKLTESDESLRGAQARYSSEIEARTAARSALEQDISNLVQQHASFAETAGAQLADQQRDYESRVALLEAELRDLRAAAQLGAAQHLEAAQLAAQRLTESEERHSSELGAAASAHAALVQQLSNLEQQHASFAEAAGAKLADQQRDHESRVALLEAELRNLRAAGQLAAAQHLEAEQEATQRLAESEERRSSELGAAASAHAALGQQLSNLERQHTSFVEAANARLADQQRNYEARLTLLDTEIADLRAAVELSTNARLEAEQQAAARAAESEARHSSELHAAAAAHGGLEEAIATLKSQHASSMEAAVEQFAEQQRQYEARLSEQAAEQSAAAERLARRESELTAASASRLALEQRLVEAETSLGHARERATAERAATVKQAAKQQAEFDARLAREVDARGAVERELAETRTAGEERLQGLSSTLDQVRADATQTVERLTNDHASAIARLEALVADRDAQLQDQAARHAVALHNAQHSLVTLEVDLRAGLAARSQQIEHLNGELQSLTRELTTSRNHRDALQLEAHRAPELARQLGATRAENRRLFERSPVSILRCSHDGVLKEANHALLSALGYRNIDELRALDFPSSIFDSDDDLRWLVQRCQNGPRQSGDCILKKKDGSRLSMRLHAAAMSADTIEIVAEDLTSLRAVEERLSKAHRMEAVGLLASEVADTCGDLLRNVNRSGDELLVSLGDSPLRAHTEVIFGDVMRAANFLRQLSAYSHKQARGASPVDVNKVLRDLEPVLKRVAGDDIELVLPRKASALYVDVDAERVERVLVNIAAYGRTRMPSGGRLIVELARVAVDRKFISKYPNVREGGHALIRVTEVRTGRMVWPIGARDAGATATNAETAESPGVDLGALQALIGECGGHLWMNAEPGGNMEVKIRLPLRPGERNAPTARSSGSAVTRWFQS